MHGMAHIGTSSTKWLGCTSGSVQCLPRKLLTLACDVDVLRVTEDLELASDKKNPCVNVLKWAPIIAAAHYVLDEPMQALCPKTMAHAMGPCEGLRTRRARMLPWASSSSSSGTGHLHHGTMQAFCSAAIILAKKYADPLVACRLSCARALAWARIMCHNIWKIGSHWPIKHLIISHKDGCRAECSHWPAM